MKISTRFSDAIHILAFIDIYGKKSPQVPLTSNLIASSIETSPVMVRQLMSLLRESNLLKTRHGAATPKLAQDPQAISLLDIYLAIEKDKTLFEIDHKTNPKCIVGGNIQATLKKYYAEAEIAAKAKLNQISLQDIINTILVKQKEKEANNKK